MNIKALALAALVPSTIFTWPISCAAKDNTSTQSAMGELSPLDAQYITKTSREIYKLKPAKSLEKEKYFLLKLDSGKILAFQQVPLDGFFLFSSTSKTLATQLLGTGKRKDDFFTYKLVSTENNSTTFSLDAVFDKTTGLMSKYRLRGKPIVNAQWMTIEKQQ